MSACGHFGIVDDIGAGGSGGSTTTHASGGGASGDGESASGASGSGGDVTPGSGSTTATGGEASGGATSQSGGSGSGATGGGGGSGSGATSSGATGGGGGSGATGSGGGGGSGGGTTFDCDPAALVCQQLAAQMVNRFTFDGVGTELPDALGGPSATVVGTTLKGSGQLTLSGSNQYVDLPAERISMLPNLSVEVWFLWLGGADWQKIFEFGELDGTGRPVSYLYLTPQAGGSTPATTDLASALRHLGGSERQLHTGATTEQGVRIQAVLLVDDSSDRLVLYKNGQMLAELSTPVQLGQIGDAVNRLGRSLFPGDPDFNGVLYDLRVYDAVLTDEMILKSYELGPDATFAPP